MKAERNIITMDEYGTIHFPNISNNIWMSTNELIDLFGIIYQTLKANIKAIYKSGIFDECEVQRYIKLSNGNCIDVYALPMIIALSFRLNTLGAYQGKKVYNEHTCNQFKKPYSVFECTYARMYE